MEEFGSVFLGLEVTRLSQHSNARNLVDAIRPLLSQLAPKIQILIQNFQISSQPKSPSFPPITQLIDPLLRGKQNHWVRWETP